MLGSVVLCVGLCGPVCRALVSHLVSHLVSYLLFSCFAAFLVADWCPHFGLRFDFYVYVCAWCDTFSSRVLLHFLNLLWLHMCIALHLLFSCFAAFLVTFVSTCASTFASIHRESVYNTNSLNICRDPALLVIIVRACLDSWTHLMLTPTHTVSFEIDTNCAFDQWITRFDAFETNEFSTYSGRNLWPSLRVLIVRKLK